MWHTDSSSNHLPRCIRQANPPLEIVTIWRPPMVMQKVVADSSPDQTKGTNFIMTVWSFLFVQINGYGTPLCSVDLTVQHQLSITVWTLPRRLYNFTTCLFIFQTLASYMWHPTAWPLWRKVRFIMSRVGWCCVKHPSARHIVLSTTARTHFHFYTVRAASQLCCLLTAPKENPHRDLWLCRAQVVRVSGKGFNLQSR